MKSMKSNQSNSEPVNGLPEVYYLSFADRFYLKDGEGNFRNYRKNAISTRLSFEHKMSKEKQEIFFAKLYRDGVIDCVTEIGGQKKVCMR